MARKYRKQLDGEGQRDVETLARLGFSARMMAEMVCGVPVEANTQAARRTRGAIRSHLSTEGIRVKAWRDGLTLPARAVAARALATSAGGRRKRVA